MRLMLLFGALLLSVDALAQPLPTAVPTRVGRAAATVGSWTPDQYPEKLTTFDVIYDNHPGSGQGGAAKLSFPSGVFSGAYVAINRVRADVSQYGTARIIAGCGERDGGGCTISWFQTNHPSWIMYKPDQVTPAYQFGDTSWIPLDISNPQTQNWIKEYVFRPILGAGYQALSVDNVSIINGWGESGVCSIAPITNCTADGGTWTQLYSGSVDSDATFINNRIAWSKEITAFAHSLGKSTIGNVGLEWANPASTARLVNAYDIWYEEAGFTGDAEPSACSPKNPSGSTGRNWINKIAFITGLNDGAGPKAYIAENSICPIGAYHLAGVGSNFEMVEYAVASYLLMKNDYSYMQMYFSNGAVGGPSYYNEDNPTARWPQFYLEHGAASGAYKVTKDVYSRAFSNTLALVNPSPTTDHTYELGVLVYHRSDCSRFTGSITVPKLSGMVLLNGEPSKCVPVKKQ